jgi:hypothetical protein
MKLGTITSQGEICIPKCKLNSYALILIYVKGTSLCAINNEVLQIILSYKSVIAHIGPSVSTVLSPVKLFKTYALQSDTVVRYNYVFFEILSGSIKPLATGK